MYRGVAHSNQSLQEYRMKCVVCNKRVKLIEVHTHSGVEYRCPLCGAGVGPQKVNLFTRVKVFLVGW